MIIVRNTKTDSLQVVNKQIAANVVGVNRITIARWQSKRRKDGTLKEEYNHFTLYFDVPDKRKKVYFAPMPDVRRG